MQTTITFKKIDTSNALKSYVQKKLDKFDRMLESPAEAYIVLSVEKIRHIAEISITCDKLKIHAKEDSESMYSSIDALMDKVKSQIKKHKEKVKRHMSGNKQSIKDESIELDFPDNPITDPILIETIDYKPMDIEDAVIELDSGKQSFFVFNNARTEQINVLYKHNNGKLGLIQPRG
ncbi:ribosome-associated translation inhibitor RaiA [Desulfobacula sp.]|uniref:ribosome hibernation-promoting factor, HPF/YfiA family n=1 Tax=Desulfobacula sp. TaxID=2593537 RepID=UPI00261DB5EC|nr:ribosome-associated translation inhibitor RaiA [Desulfobacula sp.]